MQSVMGAMLIVVLSAGGCAESVTPGTATDPAAPTPVAHPTRPDVVLASKASNGAGRTENSADGNRVVQGSVDLRSARVLDIPVEGHPIWLVSAAIDHTAVFVAIMDDGRTQGFAITAQAPHDIAPPQLPVGMPPLLEITHNRAALVLPPNDASLSTHAVLAGGRLVYLARDGDLVLKDESGLTRLPIDALPDARILVDESDRLLVLTQPTDRYRHGILGDALEASGITLVVTTPQPRVLRTFRIDPPDVIEGIAPLWVDVDGDGAREIIVTLSNDRGGARIVAFRENGDLIAESPAIGRGSRWRHQIAVASFEAEGNPLLVSVRTPHIGGVVEFFRLANDRFELISEIPGFSSHAIGSRNLDSALAGDFNADSFVELLVPDQSQTSLGILSPGGVLVMIPLDGTLTSNLSAINVDGKLYVGAATSGKLRIWIP